ncbi:hypothetical protein WMY93_004441 [Mugilogobius chulae]|uniref:Neurobeachin beta-propeller domain-containing protein n=1 Tax=Mugilogobius chulae TaxID=88201 RepID=A0AAW0Q3G9_9GOBI
MVAEPGVIRPSHVLPPAGLPSVGSHRRQISDLLDQSIQISSQCFVITADNRFIILCGFWDKSFRVYSTDTAADQSVPYKLLRFNFSPPAPRVPSEGGAEGVRRWLYCTPATSTRPHFNRTGSTAAAPAPTSPQPLFSLLLIVPHSDVPGQIRLHYAVDSQRSPHIHCTTLTGERERSGDLTAISIFMYTEAERTHMHARLAHISTAGANIYRKLTQIVFGHWDVVTCLARSESYIGGDCYVLSGSRDATLLLWYWNGKNSSIGESSTTEFTMPRAILTGHDCEVTCASVCAELGLVISGCKEGPCLVHSMNGDLLRTLEAPESCVRPRLVQSSSEGHCVVYYEKGHFCVFSVNGKLQGHITVDDSIKVRLLYVTHFFYLMVLFYFLLCDDVMLSDETRPS